MKKLVIAAVSSAALSMIATQPATAQPAHLYQMAQVTGQLDMDAIPDLNDEKMRQVQQALHDKGLESVRKH